MDAGMEVAAMTWGMPLPRAIGASRRVSQRRPAIASGMTTSAAHGAAEVQWRFHSSAISASQANASDSKATTAAPHRTSA